MFAIARQLVLVHKSALDILIEVAAIAALFAIRKYLLTKRDERESVGDTGKSKLNFFKKEEEENKKLIFYDNLKFRLAECQAFFIRFILCFKL